MVRVRFLANTAERSPKFMIERRKKKNKTLKFVITVLLSSRNMFRMVSLRTAFKIVIFHDF